MIALICLFTGILVGFFCGYKWGHEAGVLDVSEEFSQYGDGGL